MPEILFILGASSDIGRALIRMLPRGYGTVIAHGNHSVKLLSSLVKARPDLSMEVIQADLANGDETQSMLEKLAEKKIVPSRIVHLPAPPFEYQRLKQLSWARVQREWEVQCRSLFLTLKIFLPLMAEKEGGKIVTLLSSVTTGVAPRYLTHYIMAKEALLGLVRAAAAEYADKKIRINALSPGMVNTRFIQNLPLAVREELMQQTEAKRFLSADEVAAAILERLESNDGISGANFPVVAQVPAQ